MNKIKNIAGIIIIIGLIFISTQILQAQIKPDSSKSLKELLQANRHSIFIENRTLKGEGGNWLRQKAKEADVVVMGETHTSRQIPELMQALIDDLQKANEFDYLAIEVSPWTAKQMTDQLKKGKQAYNHFIKKYPSAVPFYNLKTERDLLYQVIQKSDNTQPLWGLDQIFSFATNLAFDRLETLAPTDSLRSAIRELRATGSQKIANDPELQDLPASMPAPISVYEPQTFDSLRSHFTGIEEAQQILNELSKSIKMYRLNDQNTYVSNQLRARYLRDNLRELFEHAKKTDNNPQIVVKIGGWHAFRGMTPNNALDVGNLAISIARSMGGEALNVAIICGPGSKNLSYPARTTDCWPGFLGEELEALSQNQPVLFDLTSLHPKLHELSIEMSDQLEAFLWGFDAMVIIPKVQPAEPIVSPTK